MRYRFELTIEDGWDEFWDNESTPQDVAEALQDNLAQYGWEANLRLLSREEENGQLLLRLDEYTMSSQE